MSAISNALPNQQPYFQAAPKTDQGKVDTTQSDAASPATLKTQQANAPQSTKSYESAKTRNTDGTFGPKHTVRPPSSLSTTSAPESSPAVSSVNVKV